ncbi:hypothetical protein I4U23_005510 [Adineta vaga]|uniref:TPR repeat containing protein-like protein n=1 Tax=Adineta vaga TaxID=104782 RepID=B3G4G8_ADIVA|nr:TPR repeat containing protein-like protein [Adineta vaga]UJR18603.1 hypothetical protein I4U23_005510 [Adineta vaga]
MLNEKNVQQSNEQIVQSSASIRERYRFNVENFVLVWLGRPIEDAEEKELQRIINDIYTFFNIDDCIQFISTIKHEKIFIIISELFDEQNILQLHSYVQVESIFILNLDKETQQQKINYYRKVQGIFTNIESMNAVLKDSISQADRNMIGFEFAQNQTTTSVELKNKQESSFMYTQIIKNIILQMTDTDMNDMLVYCRTIYEGNVSELKKIGDFEREYCAENSIEWYTRDSFLYRMLNKALRTLEIDAIYAMRVVIRHLDQQLRSLAQQSELTLPSVLFRGLSMPNDTFERFASNVGGLVSISNFLSTTGDHNVARMFASGNEEITAVFMCIHLDSTMNLDIAVASTDTQSTFEGAESEFLFSMGTVFRMLSVEQIEKGLWQVELELTSDADPQMKKLSNFIQRNIYDPNGPLLMLGHLMSHMNEKEKANEFYKKALERIKDAKQNAIALNHMGKLHYEMKKYDQALEYCEKAVDCIQVEHYHEDSFVSECYDNIGNIYASQDNLDMSLDYYKRSLDIQLSLSPVDQNKIAEGYKNIAYILSQQEKDDEALIYYHRALDILLVILPSLHTDITFTYYFIALSLQTLGRKEEAYCYADKIVDQSFPSNQRNTEEYHKAVQQAHKALDESKLISIYIGDLNMYEKEDGHVIPWKDQNEDKKEIQTSHDACLPTTSTDRYFETCDRPSKYVIQVKQAL